MSYCIMCGEKHNGDYHVCNACITQYHLTKEQLIDMGGLRDKEENNISEQSHANEKSEQMLQEKKQEKKQTGTEIIQQKETEPETEKNASDPYLSILRHIDYNLNNITTIMTVMFIFFVIGVCVSVFALLSQAR